MKAVARNTRSVHKRSMKARAMIEQEVNEFREALGVKPLSEEFFYLRKKGEQ